ncbi:MAG: hypothetical protein BWY84_00663 [Candidatus Aerophobetes bacterium ADurb.Bin490]|nr:MAG: hypothetical protein BWY84_00663 [Candidatus Aerophobetes bacterium ADurb.Bin490]
MVFKAYDRRKKLITIKITVITLNKGFVKPCVYLSVTAQAVSNIPAINKIIQSIIFS